MNFKKIKKIFEGPAQYPTVDCFSHKLFRVYYSKKNQLGQSNIYSFDIDKKSLIVKNLNDEPVFSLGKIGSFDQDGHAARCIVSNENKKLMYIIGWNKKISPPYHLSIGAAELINNKWIKYEYPLMDRGIYDPYFCTSPSVLYNKTESKFQMWYCSCTSWNNNEPQYLIKYAESIDGLNWNRFPSYCLEYTDFIKAIGWPTVWIEDEIYKMIFCYRGMGEYRKDKSLSYRLGYAESINGLKWKIEQIEGMERSIDGWDSEMIAYTSLQDNYLFYNGNEFGKTGIGVSKRIL